MITVTLSITWVIAHVLKGPWISGGSERAEGEEKEREGSTRGKIGERSGFTTSVYVLRKKEQKFRKSTG